MCENFKRAISEHKIYGFENLKLLETLFRAQPRAALDVFLTGDERSIEAGRRALENGERMHPNPLDAISDAVLFAWCDEFPSVRFPIVASVVSAFTLSEEGNPVAWSPLAPRLVYGAPDPIAVMREFVARLRPTMWSGSRSAILDANANLLEQFDAQGNIALEAFIEIQAQNLRRQASKDRDRETEWDSRRDERFE